MCLKGVAIMSDLIPCDDFNRYIKARNDFNETISNTMSSNFNPSWFMSDFNAIVFDIVYTQRSPVITVIDNENPPEPLRYKEITFCEFPNVKEIINPIQDHLINIIGFSGIGIVIVEPSKDIKKSVLKELLS